MRPIGKVIAVTFFLCIPFGADAQSNNSLQSNQAQQQPAQDEIIITGQRLQLQLRRDMMAAEVAAYDIFNQFNDDPRFDITCSEQLATGTRIQSDTLLCQPHFEREAIRGQGEDYLTSLRIEMDAYIENKSPNPAHVPAQAVIAAQQTEYRAKLKKVAEENPAFLEALIRYSETRERYREAMGSK